MPIGYPGNSIRKEARAKAGGGFESAFDPPAFAAGDTVTLESGSWSALSSPEAHIRDDMQGAVGQDLAAPWELGSSGGTNPKYSDDSPWAGATCARMSFLGGQFNCTAELKNLGSVDSVYISYRVRLKRLSGVESRNIKFARITGGFDGTYLFPTLGSTQQYETSNNHSVYQNGGTFENFAFISQIQTATETDFYRFEKWTTLGDVGVANGSRGVWFQNGTVSETDVVTRQQAGSYEWLTLPYYVAHDPGGDYYIDVADVFLQTGTELAHIEISNDATYVRENAVPCNCTRRTSSEADIVIPVSNLDLSAPVYAYVFEADGTRIDYGVIN